MIALTLFLASLGGGLVTLGMKKSQPFERRQQWGILDNERKLDPAMSRE